MRRKKNSRGVITTLISLMLVGILSVGTLVIESGRFQAAKTQLSEAAISAATSMIASYNDDLYGRFGLLAIDTERFTPARATEYLLFNSDGAAGYKGNHLATMYKVESVEVTGIYNLTYPSILKRQILSRSKYHVVPQNYALNAYNMNAFFADLRNKCEYVSEALTPVAAGTAAAGSLADVDAETLEALGALYDAFRDAKTWDADCAVTLNASTMAMLPGVIGTVESPSFSEDAAEINATLADANHVLGSVSDSLNHQNGAAAVEIDVSVDVSFVAGITAALRDLSSAADLSAKTVALATKTIALANKLSFAVNSLAAEGEENVLLNSYITEYFSNRNNTVASYVAPPKGTPIDGTMANATFASACVEYVFGGKSSEKDNQTEAYRYIQAIRFVNDLYAVMTSSATFDANNVFSVAAHLAWANYESLLDMELLTVYNVSVPFNKNRMLLPINEPALVSDAFSSDDTMRVLDRLGFVSDGAIVVSGSGTYTYKDHLSLGLWFVPNTEKLLRVADLVQLEMRYRQQHVERVTPTFLMSEQNTYCRLRCTGRFNSVLPMLSLDTGNQAKGIGIHAIKYAGY